jgi:hypothetical protein
MRWQALAILFSWMASASVPAAQAAPPQGMPVEPGMWEFRSSIPDPLAGQPVSQVHRTCVRERVVTPERVMAKLDQCRIGNVVVKGSSARWKMRCQTPAGVMTGGGSLKSTTTAVAGTFDLSMFVGGFEIPITGAFKGKRVGNCR